MFEKLKGTFQKLAKVVTEKELTEENVKSSLEEFQLQLISNDVASPVARDISRELERQLVGKEVKRLTKPKEIIQKALKDKVSEILNQGNRDILKEIQKRASENLERIKEGKKIKPLKLMFIGPNGAGKTTTIAKLAWKLKKNEITSLLVASDTFRAGAQEQLIKHAERLDLPLIKGDYGRDPASVGYDAISFAKSKRLPIILIDTAGRLGGDVNLIEEMRKMVRIIEPEHNIFVGSALSGNELANQAEKFREGVGIDGNILTKVDADVKGGAALTLAFASQAPILFIGVGQEHSDLKRFNAEWFARHITSW